MRVDILTLFPSMFSPLKESILGRAVKKGILNINITDIRDFAVDKHRTADDRPYGGGAGMVMKPELLIQAVKKTGTKGSRVIFLGPSGKRFDDKKARELSKEKHLVFICGHYEGIDERVKELIDEEISVGDFILTGGELPAMSVIDALSRYIPGVLGDKTSAQDESFANDLLEYPHYTKPALYNGGKVPEVLVSGDHKKIAQWRRQMSVVNTFIKRPDLLANADLGPADMDTLQGLFIKENA